MSTISTTSKVGRKPVIIPAGVNIKIEGQQLDIKGPKGHITLPIHLHTEVSVDAGQVHVKPVMKEGAYCRSGSGSKLRQSISGTVRAKIHNAVQGVAQGFERKLALVGVGYRAQAKGKTLNLTIGFSHPVEFAVPEGIVIETPSQTEIVVKGADKHLVGHVASTIRNVRPPEPYKGKGIRYVDENVVRK